MQRAHRTPGGLPSGVRKDWFNSRNQETELWHRLPVPACRGPVSGFQCIGSKCVLPITTHQGEWGGDGHSSPCVIKVHFVCECECVCEHVRQHY